MRRSASAGKNGRWLFGHFIQTHDSRELVYRLHSLTIKILFSDALKAQKQISSEIRRAPQSGYDVGGGGSSNGVGYGAGGGGAGAANSGDYGGGAGGAAAGKGIGGGGANGGAGAASGGSDYPDTCTIFLFYRHI